MSQKSISKFFQRIYFLMFIGLILSGIIALIFSSSQSLSSYLFSNPFLLFFLIIIELILVFAISGIIKRLSSKTALILFLIYSVINGVVLSSIFLVYTASSIAFTFFAVSSMFAVLAIYGFYTELDLSSFGPVLFGALIALIITSIANFFLNSSSLDFFISIIGIILFCAITLYDNQKFKNIAYSSSEKVLNSLAVIAALNLYLDFVNLFLFLLRFLGRKK